MPTAQSCQTNSVLIKWFIIHWRYGTHTYPYGETWSAFLSSICWKNFTARFHIGTNAIALKQTMGIFPLCFGFPFFCISFSPNMCELWDFESPRHVHLVKVETCGAHICFFPPGPIVKATHNWTLPSRHSPSGLAQLGLFCDVFFNFYVQQCLFLRQKQALLYLLLNWILIVSNGGFFSCRT